MRDDQGAQVSGILLRGALVSEGAQVSEISRAQVRGWPVEVGW